MKIVDRLTFIDPLTKKRVRKFLNIRRAYVALIVLIIAYGLSLCAELLANNQPIAMSYNGSLYFPVFKVYKGTDFGLTTPFEPDYKALEPKIKENGWMLKPLIWWGYNESDRKLASYPSGPSKEHLMGTDDRGRDVLVRLIYGFRISVTFALVTLVFALIMGTLIGGMQGFFGGKIDLIGQRFVEVWVSLPYIFMIILIVNVFEPGLSVLIFVLAAFSWMPTSYYMRAECLRLKNMDFAMASVSLGASRTQVFFSHIVPNAITPMVTLAPFVMSLSVASLSFLDYMGLGVQPPTASIGELLKQGRQNFINAWWLAFYPFIVLVFSLILINFVGEGVRKAFDPRANVD